MTAGDGHQAETHVPGERFVPVRLHFFPGGRPGLLTNARRGMTEMLLDRLDRPLGPNAKPLVVRVGPGDSGRVEAFLRELGHHSQRALTPRQVFDLLAALLVHQDDIEARVSARGHVGGFRRNPVRSTSSTGETTARLPGNPAHLRTVSRSRERVASLAYIAPFGLRGRRAGKDHQ